jgi:HEPN domain-containing protein
MKTDYSRDSASWLQWADHTYAGARTLFHSGNFFLWFPAAILGHQALEMYLKAALIKRGHSISRSDVWGHDLTQLVKLLFTKRRLPRQLKKDLQIFTDYFNELRYPSRLVKVEELGEEQGKLLDGLVWNLRPLAETQPDGQSLN